MLRATSSFLTLVLPEVGEEEAKQKGTMESVLQEELALHAAWNVEGWESRPRERRVWSLKPFMEAYAISWASAVALTPDTCVSRSIAILL